MADPVGQGTNGQRAFSARPPRPSTRRPTRAGWFNVVRSLRERVVSPTFVLPRNRRPPAPLRTDRSRSERTTFPPRASRIGRRGRVPHPGGLVPGDRDQPPVGGEHQAGDRPLVTADGQ